MISPSETGRAASDLIPAQAVLKDVNAVFSLAPKGLIKTSSDGHFGEIEISPEKLATSGLSDPIKEFFAAICAIADPEGEMAWVNPQPTVRLLNTGLSGSIWLGMISQSHGVFGLMVEGRTAAVFHGERVSATIMASPQSTESADEHMARLNEFGISEAYQNLVEHVESIGAAQVTEQLFAFAKSVTQSPTPAAA